MNALLLLIICVVILALGYIFYGTWIEKVWNVKEGEDEDTPAHTMEDGVDYVPAKAPVLMGHHFSSIAGAGPITGPIGAAMFGWLPVTLWVLIGGIFFGGVHDFGALYASICHKGQSIGEIISANMSRRAKRLFIIFSYLTLILVVAAFSSIVGSSFGIKKDKDGNTIKEATDTNASVAMVSILFIVIAVIFGFIVKRFRTPMFLSTIIGIIGIVLCLVIGMNFHPIYLTESTWMYFVGLYIAIASVTPVWILLQPRDYLSSFLLYFMIITAFIGVIGAHPSMDAFPAVTGFAVEDKNGKQLIFPILFTTVACGAISGFHSLVSSGTTSKQLNKKKEAKPIAYGGMLLECVVAEIRGLAGLEKPLNTLLVVTYSAFCLTSLDTATRLARFMFQEFWLEPGQTAKDVKEGWKKIMVNPYVATLITVVLGVALGLTGYQKIWGLFGAANQLLAGIGLLAVATWLGNIGKKNFMILIPMVFMMIVTICSLVLTVKNQITIVVNKKNEDWGPYAQIILGSLLVILSIVLVIEGVQTLLGKNKKEIPEKNDVESVVKQEEQK